MTDDKKPSEKSLTDHAKEFVEGVREALEDLLPKPEPELIPIPVQRPRRRYR